jgi:hypothetical protein
MLIRSAPRREPPFDDEVAGTGLRRIGPHDRTLPFVSPIVAPTAISEGSREVVDPYAPPPRDDVPEPTSVAHRLMIGIIEVATGRRPAGQLAAYTSPPVLRGLSRDAGRLTRLGTTARPAILRSVRVNEPADGVAEVAAVVDAAARCRAVAMRLEAFEGRWRCVRLQIG